MKVKNTDVLSTLVVIIYIHMRVVVTQEDPQSVSFVNYSFKDDICDWESISAGWKIGQGSPTTSGTGSAHNHTLKNARRIYIYLDPKSVNTSQSQVLQSPLLPWSCLLLWYRICGNDTGKLTVSIETKDTTTATKFSTTQSGNRTIYWSQEGELDDKWHSVEITEQTEEAFSILFVGTTKIQNGAIAVDENKLSKCCCKDNCGFDVRFCNWIQRTSDGFRWIRTGCASFPKTTGSQSGNTNNTTGPQSHRNTKQTTPQSGSTNKTTDPQSHRNTMQTTSQSGSTNNTTGLQSHRNTMQTTPRSGRTNKTTDPQSSRTNQTTGPQRRQPNMTGTNVTSTTRDFKESTFSVGWENTYTNTTRPPQSNVTEASTNGSGHQITTQGHIPKVTGTNATSTTRDLRESTFSSDEAFTKTTRPAESYFTESYTTGSGRQITTQRHIPQVTVCIIIGSLAGTMTLVAVVLFASVCIYRTKRYSKKRNTVNARLQLSSYDTLQHGINIGDYLHVVYSPSHSITESPSIPFPHNITSINDNEYDYVS